MLKTACRHCAENPQCRMPQCRMQQCRKATVQKETVQNGRIAEWEKRLLFLVHLSN